MTRDATFLSVQNGILLGSDSGVGLARALARGWGGSPGVVCPSRRLSLGQDLDCVASRAATAGCFMLEPL